MHELSIATSLVSLAVEAAADMGGGLPIEVVRVRVGDASGVVIEALEFAWDAAREDTACGEARLEIERVPVRIRCLECHDESDLAPPLSFRCPICSGPTQVLTGRELDLIALVLMEDETLPSQPERVDHVPTHP